MVRMTKEEFLIELEKIGIKPTEKQLKQLEKFYELLIEWNQKINLTRITSKEEVYLKHFYDSLTLNRVVDLKNTNNLCDIGTGAGFPGIVLKIIFPNIKITLIDSLQKRVNYLNIVIKELGLEKIEAIHTRGEDFKGNFDVVTSRAVANIEKLVNYTMHLVAKDGIFVAMKGDIANELTPEVEQKLNKKYKIIKIEKFLLPLEESKRSLVVMKNK
ncbi:MAG: 16S rRNA (guanine(527)-N(7))-methyltransferase RsmG [Bacilli bacterium]|nr:16S rRNA (guanine(527)-N(7))-methyltransferase RsmG [Bacilli bacterium]